MSLPRPAPLSRQFTLAEKLFTGGFALALLAVPAVILLTLHDLPTPAVAPKCS